MAMKHEYDFSNAARGASAAPTRSWRLPVHLDPEVLAFLIASA